jgi:hypothetical protein
MAQSLLHTFRPVAKLIAERARSLAGWRQNAKRFSLNRREGATMKAKLVIAFAVSCALLPNAGIAATIASVKVATDLKGIYDALDTLASSEAYAESALRELQAGRRPPPPEPTVFLGRKLSAALDAGVAAAHKISIPDNILGPSGLPDLNSAINADKNLRRAALAKAVSYAGDSKARLADAKEILEKIVKLDERAQKAFTAATVMANALGVVSAKVPQAYIDVAGLAVVDFEANYLPKISDIESIVSADRNTLQSRSTGAATKIANMVQNLALLLQGESESLQREQSNANLDADKFAKESTQLIQEITTLKSQIIQLTSERDGITQRKGELYNTWMRAKQTADYWTDQFLYHSGDLNQLQENSDQMGRAAAVNEAAYQAYNVYFLPALDRLRTIDQSINELQQRVSDLQPSAEQVSHRYQDAQNNSKQLQILLQANIVDQQTLQQIGSI